MTPVVSGISPKSGLASGGTVVIITGANFSGATAVTFAGHPALTFTINSGTQITAKAPAGTVGVAGIVVTTPKGSSPTSWASDFTYTAIPVTVRLAVSARSLVPGQGMTYTVTVTATSGSVKPTGTVTLTGLPGHIRVTLKNGVGALITSLPLGRYTVGAQYAGSTQFLANHATTTVVTVTPLVAELDPLHKGKSIVTLGLPTGSYAITLQSVKSELIVTFTQTVGGHNHAHEVFLVKNLSKIEIFGVKLKDKIKLIGILKLPIAFGSLTPDRA